MLLQLRLPTAGELTALLECDVTREFTELVGVFLFRARLVCRIPSLYCLHCTYCSNADPNADDDAAGVAEALLLNRSLDASRPGMRQLDTVAAPPRDDAEATDRRRHR